MNLSRPQIAVIPILAALLTALVPTAADVSAFDIRDAFFNAHPQATDFRTSFGAVISRLLPNAILVAGLVFFYLIIYGGYLLIVYGGKTNSAQSVEKGRNSITYGLIGLLLVISAYFILQIISTVTGINFTNI